MRKEEQEADGIEVTWGKPPPDHLRHPQPYSLPLMFFVRRGPTAHQHVLQVQCTGGRTAGRAQRATGKPDTFRLLKHSSATDLCILFFLQQDKEYYDDLEMELELADEDDQVL